jgi:hypothetical protein
MPTARLRARAVRLPAVGPHSRRLEEEILHRAASRSDHSRSEFAMALTGIAAVARYGFGMARDGEISFDYRVLTDQGRIDFDTASQMADDIDPGGKRDVLGEAWTLAASLVADPESWAAIEWLAGIVEGAEHAVHRGLDDGMIVVKAGAARVVAPPIALEARDH